MALLFLCGSSCVGALAPTIAKPAVSLPAARRAVAPACVSAASASWVVGTLAAGASGTVFVTRNLRPWYASLTKPTWSPPNSAFAPVWSTLYTLIGISCARTLGASPGSAPRALHAFSVQAVLNLAWAPLFFGAHRIRAAFFLSVCRTHRPRTVHPSRRSRVHQRCVLLGVLAGCAARLGNHNGARILHCVGSSDCGSLGAVRRLAIVRDRAQCAAQAAERAKPVSARRAEGGQQSQS